MAVCRPYDTLLNQVDVAVRILRRGGVISVPTDTLYGLAASVLEEHAVERLFRIKGRPRDRALPLLLSEPADIARYAVDVPQVAWTLAQRFLPGALTLVLRKGTEVPDVVAGGSDTVGIRVPDHWAPRAIVRELGTPITGTSANRSGLPGLTSAEAVSRQLGEEVDFVFDAGDCPVGVASTVVDVSGPSPVIVREGAISLAQIEEACGTRVAILSAGRPYT